MPWLGMRWLNCRMKLLLVAIIGTAVSCFAQAQNVLRYDLTIDHKMVHYSGKKVHAIAVNGQIPGPTLEFTEGGIAEIHVKNNLHELSSVHWHGILLPNEQDGVPFLTITPIQPMGTDQNSREHYY